MFFAGAIDCLGGTGANNWATGVSGAAAFALPQTAHRIYLVADQTGVQWEMYAGASGPSFQTTAARGGFLNGPNVPNGPFSCVVGAQTTVAVFSATSGTRVRVFKAPNT